MISSIKKQRLGLGLAVIVGGGAIGFAMTFGGLVTSQAVEVWKKVGQTIYTTPTTLPVNLGGTLDVAGDVEVGALTDGAGALAIATSTGTTNITASILDTDSVIEIMINTGATASMQLPATSTMTDLFSAESKHRTWLFHNATTSTMAMTFLAGAGMDLVGVTTNDDVIDETEYMKYECWQMIDSDLTCAMTEWLHLD